MDQVKPTIKYNDFAKLDIRLGTVKTAEVPEGSEKLVKFLVDFGEEVGERIIFSGIKQWYSPEELVGKQLAFVVNLEPRKMGDFGESQGMILAAGEDKPVLMTTIETVSNGSAVR